MSGIEDAVFSNFCERLKGIDGFQDAVTVAIQVAFANTEKPSIADLVAAFKLTTQSEDK